MILTLLFCFFVVQALFVSYLRSQAPLLDVIASCFIPFPLFLVVVGMVASNLSCFVLPLPSHSLFVCLSVRVRSIQGDVGLNLFTILNIWGLGIGIYGGCLAIKTSLECLVAE
jgi:hypothetical protein